MVQEISGQSSFQTEPAFGQNDCRGKVWNKIRTRLLHLQEINDVCFQYYRDFQIPIFLPRNFICLGKNGYYKLELISTDFELIYILNAF